MRSIGSRRGNPILRASVEQSARRRMESWSVPSAGEPAARESFRAATFSREFFERVRAQFLPRMTPALTVDDAEVRYWGAAGLGLWGMQASHGLVLAVECADTPSLLVERARRWISCLRTRSAPGMLLRSWGRPVYGARFDRAYDALEVLWSTPGEWCGMVLADEPGAPQFARPPHWSDDELART